MAMAIGWRGISIVQWNKSDSTPSFPLLVSPASQRFLCEAAFVPAKGTANKAVRAEKPISHELHEAVEAVGPAKSRNFPFACDYQCRADRHGRALKEQPDACLDLGAGRLRLKVWDIVVDVVVVVVVVVIVGVGVTVVIITIIITI